MSERGGVVRTIIAGVVIGVLLSGCGSMAVVAPNGHPGVATGPLCPNANGSFPDCKLWCWNAAMPTHIESLGYQIMAAQNAYCQIPSSGTQACTADPTTWPRELTSEYTWKVLTEFDFNGADWSIPGGQVHVSRSMRVPYLIAHSLVQRQRPPLPRPQPGQPPVSLGRENLLIGYARTSETFTAEGSWEAVPTACPPPYNTGDSVGLLAEFVVINMMATGDSQPSHVTGWNSSYLQAWGRTNVWSFRGSNISVDYSFSFPVATTNSSNQTVFGRIYVGYEGGGAY
jgi:hypothetical protein